MPTIDEQIDAILDQGVTAEQLARRAQARMAQSTKDFFLSELLDEDGESVVTLTCSDWSKVQAFLAKAPTEQHHPQRLFQVIRADIAEALAAQNETQLINSLLLGVKAMA